MNKSNYGKAQKLLEICLQIDEVARRIYLADNNHTGSNCKPTFESKDLLVAHLAMGEAVEAIEKELDRL